MTLTVRRADSPEAVEDGFDVRRDVFIDEQDVDEDLEMDGKDDEAVHFVAYDDGRAVGTARVRTIEGDASGGGGSGGESDRRVGSGDVDRRVAKVERVAVREAARGAGVGRAIMRRLESWAADRGIDRLKLNSQTRVEAFYEKLGYETTSGVFQEAGIDHVTMEKALATGQESDSRTGSERGS